MKKDSDLFRSLRYGKKVRITGSNGNRVDFYCVNTDSDGQGMLLSKECIAAGPFRVDWRAKGANAYDSSDVKPKVDAFFELMRHGTLAAEKPEPEPQPQGISADDIPAGDSLPDSDAPTRQKITKHRQKKPRRYGKC